MKNGFFDLIQPDEIRSGLGGRLRKKIKVATFYAYCWTNPSIYLACGALLQWRVTQGGQFFIGLPQMGAHFMPKTEKWLLWTEGDL